MKLILKRKWDVLDATDPNNVVDTTIEAGEYEVERIPCPCGHDCNWLVLVGTKIGASEGSWRQWRNGEIADNPDHSNFGKPIDWEEFEVIIEE